MTINQIAGLLLLAWTCFGAWLVWYLCICDPLGRAYRRIEEQAYPEDE